MRRTVSLALLCALAMSSLVARADDLADDPLDDMSAVGLRDHLGQTTFGLRMAVGGLHVGSHNLPVFTDGLQAAVAVGLGFRAYGEAALLWDPGSGNVAMDEHAFGVRGELGLRHKLTSWKLFYLDGELGGGAAFAGDSQTGNHTIPAGFAGLRLGYDITGSTDNARFLEAAFDLRFYETPQGHNWIFGVSFGWGK